MQYQHSKKGKIIPEVFDVFDYSIYLVIFVRVFISIK